MNPATNHPNATASTIASLVALVLIFVGNLLGIQISGEEGAYVAGLIVGLVNVVVLFVGRRGKRTG